MSRSHLFCCCEKVNKFINKISDKNVTVLITGSSGSGKSRLAKSIHEKSKRSHKKFVEVHCSTIPSNLLESELFGHMKGSFTGATEHKEGKVQSSHGGTLFLDEIGELPLDGQAKVLRLIQDKVVCKIGSNKDEKVDIRIILATNKNLEKMVQEGTFREDLYFRINMFQCEMPKLKNRKDEVLKLAKKFIKEFDKKSEFKLDLELQEILVNYDWPGNIRELKNVIERLCFLSEDGILKKDDLPEYIFKKPTSNKTLARTFSGLTLKDLEKAYILETLEKEPCLDRAANTLGITKVTLWRKRKEYSKL